MKKITLLIIVLTFTLSALAQDESLRQQIDDVTFSWDTESKTMETYDGLLQFCKDKAYRDGVIEILDQIHHYDSVLYERAQAASKKSDDKEIKKLIKEIESFEDEYSMKGFIAFLYEECKAQSALEKNSKDLKGTSGSDGYDSQVYMLEIELQKYVKHITKRVDSIRKHVHHLGVK